MEESTSAVAAVAVEPVMPEITAHLLMDCGVHPAFAERYVEPFKHRLPTAGITTPLRFIHLMAQLLVESATFKRTEEYADGSAYEGRRSLGNVKPGDGKRFKGRGLIQITGRYNYVAASKALGVDYVNNPEWMERPEDAVAVSLWYWTDRHLNVWADRDDVLSISQIINMGSIPKVKPKEKLPNGYAERRAFLGRCRSVVMSPKPAKTKTVDD